MTQLVVLGVLDYTIVVQIFVQSAFSLPTCQPLNRQVPHPLRQSVGLHRMESMRRISDKAFNHFP